MLKKYILSFFPCSTENYNATPRERWVASRLAELPGTTRLLDAGAGEQAYKKYCGHLNYVAQDFGQYTGHGDGKGLQTGAWDTSALDIVSDITAIPEPDASFDAILCVEVLEHLTSPTLALKEFSRLLKPGGQLILTAPFCAFTHFSPYFFHTGFSPYWYRHFLPEYGFDILECTPNGNFSTYLLQEVTRIPSIAERYMGISMTKIERIGLRLVQSLLTRMIAADTSSSEFTCFGYHVLAKKRAHVCEKVM